VILLTVAYPEVCIGKNGARPEDDGAVGQYGQEGGAHPVGVGATGERPFGGDQGGALLHPAHRAPALYSQRGGLSEGETGGGGSWWSERDS